MGVSADAYREHLRDLSPQGPAWSREPDVFTTRLLDSWAQELARIDARVDALIDEADPRTAIELLPDWERVFGLPDECYPEAATIAERRGRLLQKIAFQGGQSPQFFIDFLAALGYPGATVTEFRPFKANSKCNAALNQGGWRFAWRIHVPISATSKRFNAVSRSNEPLDAFGDPGLACVLAKYSPAHTVLFIAYGDA
ncbi:YmfQ family protein [Paraburkholderia terrae]|uniref:YmfQ family protein n=1 Tax=Paraburkholderia terrae TaxID=311230 RepID=UPI001EE208F2|nr:YmfQ family protein [Paraburkholderia terrae]GJH05044.1 DUF2313 domain-containing protein [Paraburkholderia terrae]